MNTTKKNKKSIAAFLKHCFIKNKRSKGLIPKFYFLKIECMHLKFEHYYFGSKIFKLVHETQKTKNKRSSWLVIVQWDLVCLFCVCYFLFLCDYQSIFYYLFFPPVEYVVRSIRFGCLLRRGILHNIYTYKISILSAKGRNPSTNEYTQTKDGFNWVFPVETFILHDCISISSC